MLIGKMFAGLAAYALLVAILFQMRVLPDGRFWLVISHVNFDPFQLQILVTVACTILALAYFGVARLARHPANELLGIISVYLVAVNPAIWLILGLTGPPVSLILIIPATWGLYLGLALSIANIASVFVRDGSRPK